MVDNILDKLLNARVFEFTENKVKQHKIERDGLEFISNNDSKFVPIKITKEEFEKTLKCQKAMLSFMFKEYQKAVGTENEAQAKMLYKDSLEDYCEFIRQHPEYAFNNM